MSTDPVNQKEIDVAGFNGDYEVVNINFDSNAHELAIKQFNGRQGDGERPANIQLVKSVEGGVAPFNFDGLHPSVVGQNAQDKTFEFGSNYKAENVAGGLLHISIPSSVYQVAGQTKNAYLRMVDGNGTVISSVPIVFGVEFDASQMTTKEAITYLESVDTVVQNALAKFDPLNNLISALKASTDTANGNVQTLIDLINKNGVGVLSKDQTWDGVNTFKQAIKVLDLVDANKVQSATDILAPNGDIQSRYGWIHELFDFMHQIQSIGQPLTHSATAWLNGAHAMEGTNGFWMRQFNIGGLHILQVFVACWLPDGTKGTTAIVSIPSEYIGSAINNNFFAQPVWATADGTSTAFGLGLNSANQLVVTPSGSTGIGINGSVVFTN